MNIYDITNFDVNNGPGFRTTVWISGCPIKCKGCHNQALQDPNSGKPLSQEHYDKLNECLSNPNISGLTISGGEPLVEENLDELYKLIKWIRVNFRRINIWIYTGYSLENLSRDQKDILQMADKFVEGPYIEELRDTSLAFRGSSNQRILDPLMVERLPKIEELDFD